MYLGNNIICRIRKIEIDCSSLGVVGVALAKIVVVYGISAGTVVAAISVVVKIYCLGAGAGVSVNVDWTEFDASEMQKSIENVVDGAVDTAKAVGNAAVEGAKAVGNAVEDGLDALGDLFRF